MLKFKKIIFIIIFLLPMIIYCTKRRKWQETDRNRWAKIICSKNKRFLSRKTKGTLDPVKKRNLIAVAMILEETLLNF